MSSKRSTSKPESNDSDTNDQGGKDPTGYVVSRGYCGEDRRGNERRDVVERRNQERSALDKAQALIEVEELAQELADDSTGLERRRGPGRRRSDFMRSAEEGEMTREQFLFVMAIDAFKQANNKMFPTWTDVLEVIRLLGYRKTMESELTLRNAEDWTESADAPAGVHDGAGHLTRDKKKAA